MYLLPNIPNILATFAQPPMSPPFRSATNPRVPLFLGMHNLQRQAKLELFKFAVTVRAMAKPVNGLDLRPDHFAK